MNSEKTVLAATGTGVLLLAAIGLHAVGQFGGVSREDAPVEAVTLDASNYDEHATAGKEADAIYGDIALRNGFLTAVIAQPLRPME